MNIGDAEQFVARLAVIAAGLGQAWSNSASQLAATVSQLGGGPLGRRFMAAYLPVHDRLGDDAAKTLNRSSAAADAGRQSVKTYQNSDNSTAVAMRQVPL